MEGVQLPMVLANYIRVKLVEPAKERLRAEGAQKGASSGWSRDWSKGEPRRTPHGTIGTSAERRPK